MGIFSFSKKGHSDKLNWNDLESVEQLESAYAESNNKTTLFFKHSTRCSISSMALSRFESKWQENEGCKLYFIDLLVHRDVSNRLAELSGVEHQSPQAILVKNNKVVYDGSHSGISASAIHDLI